MATKTKQGASTKAQYAGYKASGTYKANREAKLLKVVVANPNDKVAAQALKNIKYRRKKPAGAWHLKGKDGNPVSLKQATWAAESKRNSNWLNLTMGAKHAAEYHSARVSFKLKDRISYAETILMDILKKELSS